MLTKEQKRSLFQKAKSEFLAKGWDFSLDEIAQQTSISSEELAASYSSKDDLIREIIINGIEEATDVFNNVLQRRGKADLKLNRLVRELLRIYEENPLIYKLTGINFQHLNDDQLRLQRLLPEPYIVRYYENTAIIARLIARGQSEGLFTPRVDPLQAAFILRGMFNSAIVFWEGKGKHGALTELADSISRIFLKGLYR